MTMDRNECWVKACELAGFKGDGRSPAAQIEATVEPLFGAEFVAVNALLSEAGNRCLSLDVDGAAECIALAAAMAGQRGRVLGALRAAQAVEDAFWPKKGGGCPSSEAVKARLAMTDNGFGPQEPKAPPFFPMTAQVADVARFLAGVHPRKGVDELLEYFAPEDREKAREHVKTALLERLPRGTCGECGRDDVLLFGRTKHGLVNKGREATLLTFHDDRNGVACPGGGKPAEKGGAR
jgi:hypothetical protein